ncbi:helix-turn-helix transcriptional regulator [Rhodopseudomonas sp. P1]|uniref:helix-turn-helix domain-containing protein n=1 Tax=Rhodopseudomonas sp. P1 TaxID=3434357 RepID=UPI0031FDACD9
MLLIVCGPIRLGCEIILDVAESTLNLIQKNVRNRRKQLGVSQEELADRSGLHRTYIGAIERGERNLTVASLEKLARALKCRVSDLVSKP